MYVADENIPSHKKERIKTMTKGNMIKELTRETISNFITEMQLPNQQPMPNKRE